jgi:hypothetical protein
LIIDGHIFRCENVDDEEEEEDDPMLEVVQVQGHQWLEFLVKPYGSPSVCPF